MLGRRMVPFGVAALFLVGFKTGDKTAYAEGDWSTPKELPPTPREFGDP